MFLKMKWPPVAHKPQEVLGTFYLYAEKIVLHLGVDTWRSPCAAGYCVNSFPGSIISDGLVMPHSICFGKGAREDFKDAYMNAKRTNAIRFSI